MSDIKNDFCQLHNHSCHSLLDGLSSIDELIDCASGLGFKSLALTDHGTCSGLLEFQKKCIEKSIKPILGMETYIVPNMKCQDKSAPKPYHLILLAKNEKGYKNLIKLSSLGYLQGFYYKPRIDFNLLQQHHEGLIVSTACVAGEISTLLWRHEDVEANKVVNIYKELFKDDFYIEVMMHTYFTDKIQEDRERKLASMLYKIAKNNGVRAICTQDTHYAFKSDYKAHDVLLSIQTLDCIKDPDRLTFGSDDFYLKSYEEMLSLYEKAPELLVNTKEIADKIETKLIKTGKNLFPDFKLPQGFKTGEEYLKALVVDGMKKKGFINIPEYRDRIKYEMSVITKCNYTMYFLILWDIIQFARSNKVAIGVGRGSAVSSLCLYVLDVTRLDPIKYNLIFERFLNPERISPPDVDMDFDYYRRDEVYNYIVRTYGTEYCSQIGVYQTFQAKASIRRVAKAMDLGDDWEVIRKAQLENKKIEEPKNTLDVADALSKMVPEDAEDVEDALKKSSELRMASERYEGLIDNAIKVEGKLASSGVHPAGVLISKEKCIDVVPLKVSKDVVCSQYVGPEVEEIGLVKYDILALKTLSVLDKTRKMIKERHGKDIDIDKLEPTDPKVLDSLNHRSNHGIFQFESDGMCRLLANIKVDDFEDMIVANALFRPGPLEAGVLDMYADFKHGRRKIEYLHPLLEKVLKKTYGIICFQECVMNVSRVLAGFTGGQADTLRKVIGKKKPELIKKEKLDELFINGCIKNGVSKDLAEKIFEQIKFFGGYGFNRCLSGDTFVLNKTDNSYFKLSELCNYIFSSKYNKDGSKYNTDIILDSYIDGKMVSDKVVEVFETGEQEIFETEFDNGLKIKCTLEHKFMCEDNRFYAVKDIVSEDLCVLYQTEELSRENKNLLKCKIKSIKSLGKQKTYNLTMLSDQHNYRVFSTDLKGSFITSNSHSAAYSFIAYQCCYLKIYYPLEFMCNLLTSEIDNNDKNLKLNSYIEAAAEMDIKCWQPNINTSKDVYIIDRNEKGKDVLRTPLTILKGVGSKAVEDIMKNQPFKNLEDFIRRSDLRKVNSKVFKTLVTAGCMSDWKMQELEIIAKYEEIKEALDKEKKAKEKQMAKMNQFEGQSLFDVSKDYDKIKF